MSFWLHHAALDVFDHLEKSWPGEAILSSFFLACLAQERVTANKRAKTRAQTHFGLLCGEKRVLGPLQVSVTSVCWTCLGLGRLDCVAFRVRGFWILVELDFRSMFITTHVDDLLVIRSYDDCIWAYRCCMVEKQNLIDRTCPGTV